jgi:Asp/Glu/hydantoin racemase
MAAPKQGMMAPTLVLVHTIPVLVTAFTTWCSEQMPECRILHVLDEPMLERIKRRGHGDPEDDERLLQHVKLAEAIGASGVLVTCSTVSLSVGQVRPAAAIPIFAIDDAMAAEALRSGRRIALVATADTTLEPSRLLLETEATRSGHQPEIVPWMVDGALAALLSGDAVTHDRLVVATVREAARDADVVVLAQATMARVLPILATAPPAVPVLASPQLALAEVRRTILPDAVDVATTKHEVSS